MALGVPGFDPTLHIASPVWDDYLDIFDFCHAHILYFRLQAKQGLYYDERTCSTTFLHAVQQTEYVEVVTMLQTNIDLFQDLDPGYLPPHLCMMELADQIDKSAKARVNTYYCPWAHLIWGGNNWHALSPLPEPQIQGRYSLVALCTDIRGHGHDIAMIVINTTLHKILRLRVEDTLVLIVTDGNMIHSCFARHVRDMVTWRLLVICRHKLYSSQSA